MSGQADVEPSHYLVKHRSALKTRLQKSKDELPQGLMREVLETYKPNLLTRRRR